MQITGIAPFGQQQVLDIQANPGLKPEEIFSLDLKYIFKKYLNVDLEGSFVAGSGICKS
ncbi:hypothetical protein [Pedobacter sp. L105]|uniref:hypothetical protein n=1 Tax=Pedobacter sp. L105 TaxID=1641871 RepID=UPI00131B92A7